MQLGSPYDPTMPSNVCGKRIKRLATPRVVLSQNPLVVVYATAVSSGF